jgi:hypothetical protein
LPRHTRFKNRRFQKPKGQKYQKFETTMNDGAFEYGDKDIGKDEFPPFKDVDLTKNLDKVAKTSDYPDLIPVQRTKKQQRYE